MVYAIENIENRMRPTSGIFFDKSFKEDNMIYQHILSAKKRRKKSLLAILLDPDKVDLESISEIMAKISNSEVDFIFVGGSTVEEGVTQNW